MIGIAILAIIAAIPISFRNGFGWLNRETDYRWALRNARWTLEELKRAPFDTLPPRVVTVDQHVQFQAGAVDVSVRGLDGRDLPVARDPASGWPTWSSTAGVIPVLPRGKRVVLDYAYYPSDRGEAHTVPSTGRLPLDNAPVTRIDAVWLARGDSLDPLSGWKLSGSELVLPSSAVGRVVRVDYAGERVRSRVSGRFLDERLQPIDHPGPFKLLRVEESYGGTGRLALTLLRAAP